MSWAAIVRMSVCRSTQRAITFDDGRQPPGKMWVAMKLRLPFSTS
jgi:hypothetical protein